MASAVIWQTVVVPGGGNNMVKWQTKQHPKLQNNGRITMARRESSKSIFTSTNPIHDGIREKKGHQHNLTPPPSPPLVDI